MGKQYAPNVWGCHTFRLPLSVQKSLLGEGTGLFRIPRTKRKMCQGDILIIEKVFGPIYWYILQSSNLNENQHMTKNQQSSKVFKLRDCGHAPGPWVWGLGTGVLGARDSVHTAREWESSWFLGWRGAGNKVRQSDSCSLAVTSDDRLQEDWLSTQDPQTP